MSNQPYGYDPFNAGPADGQAFLLLSEGSSGTDCYYGASYGGSLNGKIAVFPDGTVYKQSAAELRQYVLALESTRKLQDIADVSFTRNVKPGDALLYNYTTGNWELQNFICGGEW
jgi:hypothetical protein